MMNPAGEKNSHDHGYQDRHAVSPAFLNALSPVYQAYFKVQKGFADDSLPDAKTGFGDLKTAAGGVEKAPVTGPAHSDWKKIREMLVETSSKGRDTDSMESARRTFESLSATMLALEEHFGHTGEKDYYRTFCPMAFDNKGAHWLQDGKEINNPYFGPSMLRCGEVQKTFKAFEKSEG